MRRLRAPTGLRSHLSAARLAVVAAAVGAGPDPDPVVAHRKAQLRVGRGVVLTPVGDEGPQRRPLRMLVVAAGAHRRKASGSGINPLRPRDASGDARSRDNGYCVGCRPHYEVVQSSWSTPSGGGGDALRPSRPSTLRRQGCSGRHCSTCNYDVSRLSDLRGSHLLVRRSNGCRWSMATRGRSCVERLTVRATQAYLHVHDVGGRLRRQKREGYRDRGKLLDAQAHQQALSAEGSRRWPRWPRGRCIDRLWW